MYGGLNNEARMHTLVPEAPNSGSAVGVWGKGGPGKKNTIAGQERR